MSGDLVAFLRARLDEDEQAARAAARAERSDSWTTLPDSWGGVLDGGGNRSLAIGYGDVMAPATAAHIARHDPARALREVEAKRRMLGRHHDFQRWCGGCGNDLTYRIDDCPELRDLAAVYADHPSYREEWRP